MNRQRNKVIPVKRFNFVHLIFFVLLIYLVIILSRYLMKEDVKITEISEGTLTQNHNYNGFIIRQEEVLTSSMDGTLTCFANDGERVAKKKVLFVVDKTGKGLKNSTEYASELSESQLNTLRKSLNYFSTSYNGQNYEKVYDFKSQLNALVYDMEETSAKKLKNSSTLSVVKASGSGTIFFTLDGYESYDEDQVTRELLDSLSVNKHRVVTGNKVSKGQSICKRIKSEEWYVILPITDEDWDYYENATIATVKFTDLDTTCYANIELYLDDQGQKLAKLTMSKFMASYAGDRVVNLQLVKNLVSGLKVPKSSIVTRELYVIPKEYGFTDGASSSVSFWTDGETGKITKITPNISYKDDYYYYIDESQIEKGTTVYRENDEHEVNKNANYVVMEKKNMKGVYNVNKGYAVFVAVEELDSNDSYSIVVGGTVYGLAIYDHIVLNASGIKEDDLLY